jgi:hypothetical protein
MSSSIVKSFVPDKTPQQIEMGGGTKTSCTWKQLLPHIEEIIGLKGNEEVIGFVADDTGLKITVRFKRKSED